MSTQENRSPIHFFHACGSRMPRSAPFANGKGLNVFVDMPGARQTLEVHVQGRVLDVINDGAKVYSFYVGEKYDIGLIQPSYEDGVLTLSLPHAPVQIFHFRNDPQARHEDIAKYVQAEIKDQAQAQTDAKGLDPHGVNARVDPAKTVPLGTPVPEKVRDLTPGAPWYPVRQG